MQDARQILDAAHEVIVLGAIAGDAGGVAFLERVRADQMRRHLAGDADERDRVHQRVGQAGDRVGRAGPGGDEQHADLAGRARVAFGGVRGALLVAHQDMANLVLAENRVVDRQHRAAGIAEHEIDALVLQRLDDHLRAGHLFRHCGLSILRFRAALCASSARKPEFRATKKAREGPWTCASRRKRDLSPSALQRAKYDKLLSHDGPLHFDKSRPERYSSAADAAVKRARRCAIPARARQSRRASPPVPASRRAGTCRG